MYRRLKVMITLSALWVGAVAAAPPPLTEAEQAAVDACFELEDERAIAACIDGLAMPLPPEIQRIVDMMLDPAVTEALDRWQQEADAATAARAEALAARGTPRDLLAAMLLTAPETTDEPYGHGLALPAHAVAWFDTARRATPADPLVAWMEATSCPIANLGCDRDAAVARLLQVDPGNAAVQLLALQAAHAAGDAIAARTHLRLAAEAGRFEPHGQAMLQLMLDARDGIALPPMPPGAAAALASAYLSDAPPDPADLQAVAAVGQWAALSLPPLQPLAERCSDAAATGPAIRQDCIGALAPIAGNRGMALYPMFALHLLVQLDDDDRWRRQLRRHAWLYEQAVPLQPSLPDARAAAQARLLAEHGEVGAWEALLEHNGIALEPPADWLPADPRTRALVTTGRPPAG